MYKYFFLLVACYGFSQNLTLPPQTKKWTTHFELISHLIIINVELNGQKNLNFILDTGSKHTLLLEINKGDSIYIHNAEPININGLGGGEAVLALKSTHNQLKFGKLQSDSLDILAILNTDLNLSSKLGIKVNGIIGYDAFKDNIIKINYIAQTITCYSKDYFDKEVSKKLKSYAQFPITYNGNKPFIDIAYKTNTGYVPFHALIDTGNSDAFWVFEKKNKNILLPKNYFKDNLGYGLNGPIMGNRSKVENIKIGEYQFNFPTASFPDSLDILNVTKYKKRDGSLGGRTLSRFNIILNYIDNILYLKPNKDFNQPFHHDLSGLNIIKLHDDLPIYAIHSIRENSVGAKQGFMEDDIIKTINGKPTFGMQLYQIYEILHSLEDKKITITIERNGKEFTKSFYLTQ